MGFLMCLYKMIKDERRSDKKKEMGREGFRLKFLRCEKKLGKRRCDSMQGKKDQTAAVIENDVDSAYEDDIECEIHDEKRR